MEVNGGYIVGTTVITDGEWHHVAATFEDDGTPDVEDILLYVDGQLETIETSLDEELHTDTAAGIDLRIGDDHSNRKWNGWIDDVRIYDEALDALAIEDLATAPPVITEFSGSTEAVSAGGAVELSWIVDEDVETLMIDNGVGDALAATTDGEGTVTVNPTETTLYTLTGTRDGTTLTRSHLVLVDEAPTINSFAVSGPSTIGFGEQAELTWDVYGATSLTLTTVGNVLGQSSAMVTPAGQTVYTLTATNSSGTSTADVTLVATTEGTPDLSWNAAGLADGALPTWEPSINSTTNQGMVFTAGVGGTVESGATNLDSVSRWVNSPGYNFASNPNDSWQDGLGNAATQEDVTWELVFRPGDFLGVHTLYNTGGNGDGTAIVLIDSILEFRFQDANNDDQRVVVATDLSAIGAETDFYHVVCVCDVDTDVTGTGTLYVNGEVVDGPTTSVGTIIDWDGGDLAELGKGNNIPGDNPFNPEAFDGDIAVFNYHAGTLLEGDLIQRLYDRYRLPPILASFEADASSVAPGANVTLSWEVDGDADGVTIDNGVGDVSGNTVDGVGTIVVTPTETTTYTITASRDGDFQTSSVKVLVGEAPTIESFVVGGTGQIPPGGESMLSWEVFGATTVTITPDPGAVQASGSAAVSPASTTTYTLTATNDSGSATAEAIVTVREANLVAWYNFSTEPNPTLLDESGNGNDADVTEGVDNPIWLEEEMGRSGVFSFDDSEGGFVRLMQPPVVPAPFEGFTVMLWAKSDLIDQGQYGTLFANGQGAANHFQIDADGAGNWRVRDSGSVNTAFGPIVEDWTHLALTWDGATASWYYNGELVTTRNVDPGSVFDEYRISVNRANDANGPVDAELDDLRIYDFALSASAIMAAMNSGPQGDVAVTEISYDSDLKAVTLTWSSVPGGSYGLDSSIDLSDWEELEDGIQSEGSSTSFTIPDISLEADPDLYFRIRQE